MAVPSPAAPACSAAAAPAVAALPRLLRPVAAAAPVATCCFFMSVIQPSMDAPAGAAACIAGVMRGAAPVLPLCRVTLGWMDSGEPAETDHTREIVCDLPRSSHTAAWSRCPGVLWSHRR